MKKTNDEDGEVGTGIILEVFVSPTGRLTLILRMMDSHCWGISRAVICSGQCLI